MTNIKMSTAEDCLDEYFKKSSNKLLAESGYKKKVIVKKILEEEEQKYIDNVNKQNIYNLLNDSIRYLAITSVSLLSLLPAVYYMFFGFPTNIKDSLLESFGITVFGLIYFYKAIPFIKNKYKGNSQITHNLYYENLLNNYTPVLNQHPCHQHDMTEYLLSLKNKAPTAFLNQQTPSQLYTDEEVALYSLMNLRRCEGYYKLACINTK